MLSWTLLLSLLACPGEENLTRQNEAPEVELVSPAAASELWATDPLVVIALITDDAQDALDLTLNLSSDVQGPLEHTAEAEPNGVHLTVSAPLQPGEHVLTLQVLDFEGAEGSASTNVFVRRNQAPELSFYSPTPTGTYLSGDPVEVRLLVEDEDDPTLVSLTWLGRPSAPTAVGSDGLAIFTLADLPPGPATLQVTGTDSRGATTATQVAFAITNADVDGDGFRGEAFGGTDCNDSDRHVYPGADERCNGTDDDCDDSIDEGVTDPEIWYPDADGDGAGVQGATLESCDPPSGYAFSSDDCDDTDPERHPGAVERCNGLDDNCDNSLPSGESTDSDGDGALACEDCNDTDANTSPSAPELCNGLDDDCDGQLPSNESTDADSDGAALCEDCDDADADRYPGAAEQCTGVDTDCDGRTDEDGACTGCTAQRWTDPQGKAHVFQFCTASTDWGTALSSCTGLAPGYDLTSIHSTAKNDWLMSVVRGTSDTWWIGAADEWNEGVWGWTDGTPFDYSNWGQGEPNNLNNEDCAALNFFQDGTWIDAACGSQRKAICELTP